MAAPLPGRGAHGVRSATGRFPSENGLSEQRLRTTDGAPGCPQSVTSRTSRGRAAPESPARIDDSSSRGQCSLGCACPPFASRAHSQWHARSVRILRLQCRPSARCSWRAVLASTTPMAAKGWCATGYLPQRAVLTGIGPVAAKFPRVLDRTSGDARFESSLVPAYVRPCCDGCGAAVAVPARNNAT